MFTRQQHTVRVISDTDTEPVWLVAGGGRQQVFGQSGDRVTTNIDSSVIIIIITMWSDWTSLSRL